MKSLSLVLIFLIALLVVPCPELTNAWARWLARAAVIGWAVWLQRKLLKQL